MTLALLLVLSGLQPGSVGETAWLWSPRDLDETTWTAYSLFTIGGDGGSADQDSCKRSGDVLYAEPPGGVINPGVDVAGDE